MPCSNVTVRYTEEPLEGMWGPCNRSREPEIGTEDEVVPMIGIELGPDCSNTETSTNTLSSNEFENNTKVGIVQRGKGLGFDSPFIIEQT